MSPAISFGAVQYAIDLHLQLDGPHWSSLEAVVAVAELCDWAEDSPAPRPVVLELAGPEPGAGTVAGWSHDANVTLVNKWERTVRRLERLGVPTVVVISGECSGQSLDLLLAVDYRIAAPDVRIGLARSENSIWPGMALHRLVQQAGMATSRRMALFGQTLTAAQALEIGLLDEVAEDPAAAVASVVRRIDDLAGPELAIRRRLLMEGAVSSHEEAIGAHLAAVDRTLRQDPVDRGNES